MSKNQRAGQKDTQGTRVQGTRVQGYKGTRVNTGYKGTRGHTGDKGTRVHTGYSLDF